MTVGVLTKHTVTTHPLDCDLKLVVLEVTNLRGTYALMWSRELYVMKQRRKETGEMCFLRVAEGCRMMGQKRDEDTREKNRKNV
jgi:hypothetical protein